MHINGFGLVLVIGLMVSGYSKAMEFEFNGLVAPAISIDELPYKNTDTQTAPSLLIMGNVGKVFIEGNRAGYRLTRTSFGALSLVGQVRSHQYIPEDSSLLERDKAVEMGVQLAKPINDTWTFQATALTDVSDTHKGQEFELGVYRRDFFGDLRVLSLLAVQQQTKKLTSYYASTDSYTANADTNFELELIGVYPVTEDIEAVMVYRHYLHGEEFKNSPITSGSETKKLSIGLGWRF